MARTRTTYRCESCESNAPKWAGQCGTCGEWNSLREHHGDSRSMNAGSAVAPNAVPMNAIEPLSSKTQSTGMPEVDRVLGGGLVQGSVTLLGGEPGVGKSTLVLQLLAESAKLGSTGLYITGEESAQQLRLRSDRLGIDTDSILVASEVSVPGIIASLDLISGNSAKAGVCVVDSVQTLHDPQVDSPPGSVAQVRAAVNRLVSAAKSRGVTMILVGHVTKDGAIAGPRVLEHAVDTVLSMEGDRVQGLRILRAAKHRFGSTHEIGLMSLGEKGLSSVEDPSGLFLSDRLPLTPGSVVSATIEGQRPLAVEVQALTAMSTYPQPKRSAKGFDAGRLGLMLAVMEQRAGVRLSKFDVYANIAGGIRVTEPGTDLALCLAIASAVTEWPVPEGMFVCGEVGLGGEIRGVGRLEQRLGEAQRLGFDLAVAPMSAPEEMDGLEVIRVESLPDALQRLGMYESSS